MPSSIGINLRVTGTCSQGGRKYMEDFFSVAYQQSEDEKDLEYAFFGIYDGHGGSEAATFAKEHLMNAIVSQKLFWSDSDQDILRAIREGYISTHYAMWREQEKWPKTSTGLPSTAGTTASVAFIRRGKIYIGHVGDSGIVLGYQEEGDKFWRAKALTHDHKPECNVEKARIISSGGKVITKSGVPRVVWNRPRIGHKGPVRRSTPIDEIPFLAVARSLGDLWSYNSALNEFVVSPDPDVKVVAIDPKNFRCLIFGTDGLWNVLSPNEAVDQVYDAEIINERIALGGGASEWTNPSKSLVDKALHKWSSRRMRADNTSVVTIMLDPPGPPKKDMIRSCPTASYGLEYAQHGGYNALQPDFVSSLPNSYGIDDGDGESMYEPNHHRPESGDAMVLDSFSTNGYAVMTRYNFDCNSHSSDMMSTSLLSSSSDVNSIVNSSSYNSHYMNSFAESYNSLLISSYENEDDIDDENSRNTGTTSTNGYYIYDGMDSSMLIENDHTQNHNQYQQHQYQQQCMAGEEGYSLTKLETRGEQQFNSMRSYIQPDNLSFQDFGEARNFNQYNNISSSYQNNVLPSENVAVEIREDETPADFNKDQQPATKEIDYCEKSSIMEPTDYQPPQFKLNENREVNHLGFDETIQINEISSSIIETSIQGILEPIDKLDSQPETKSLDSHCSTAIIAVVEQNENKIVTTEPRRLRSSILIKVDYNKRTLRSRNSLSKDLKVKLSSKKAAHLNRAVVAKILRSNNTSSPSGSTTASSCNTNPRTLIWSQRQQKKSTKSSSSVQCAIKNGSQNNEAAGIKLKQSLVCSNRPKTSINRNSNSCNSKLLTKRLVTSSPSSSATANDRSSSMPSSSSSSSATLQQSTIASSMSKRSSTSRNSAWCCPAVQTRNQVQKRISH